MKLFTSSEIRKQEKLLIDYGVSVDTLIERAGAGLSNRIKGRRVAVIIGGGNNGADGASLTLNLLDRGVDVDLYTVGTINSEYTKGSFVRLKTVGVLPRDWKECSDFSVYDCVVDCIFGIGLSREITGDYRDAILSINEQSRYIISADIPSGLSADNGKIMGVSVEADETVSFSGGKVGYFIGDGLDVTGDITYVDTGIVGKDFEAELLEDFVLPKRRRNTHKGSYGKVTIISGCPKYVGAGILATRSAEATLRAGAGLVKLCVPYSMRDVYGKHVLEATLDFLPDDDGWIAFDKNKLDELIDGCDVIAIGMGLGKTDEVRKIVEYLLSNCTKPLVLDADALNVLVGSVDILKKGRRVVVTPHLGEFGRLIGKPISDIDFLDDAKRFARDYGVTLHLKGPTINSAFERLEAILIDSKVSSTSSYKF